MHIPDEAVEAAVDALTNAWGDAYYNQAAIRAALSAALPIILGKPTGFWIDADKTRVAMARTDQCPLPLYALKEPQPWMT